MLKRIHIQHFKSVGNEDIRLGDLTIFVGTNGSGKSNIIDAISFLREAAEFGLDRAFSVRHGVESVRQWSPTKPYNISLTLAFKDENFRGSYNLSVASARGLFSVRHEDLETQEITIFEDYDLIADKMKPDEVELAINNSYEVVRLKFSRKKEKIERADEFQKIVAQKNVDQEAALTPEFFKNSDKLGNDVLKTIKIKPDEAFLSLRHYQLYTLRQKILGMTSYSIFPNTLRAPQEPSSEAYLQSDGKNISSILLRMARSEQGQQGIARITEYMQRILPGYDKITIESGSGYLWPQVHVKEQNNKTHTFNVSQLSDGTLRVLGLLTALYQHPRPTLIAIEEPEQTVHPGILEMLAEVMREVSGLSQVIVTTHSPDFIDFFSHDKIIAVQMTNSVTKTHNIGEHQIKSIRDGLFTLGEIMRVEGFDV
jgi:predicted ATPase